LSTFYSKISVFEHSKYTWPWQLFQFEIGFFGEEADVKTPEEAAALEQSSEDESGQHQSERKEADGSETFATSDSIEVEHELQVQPTESDPIAEVSVEMPQVERRSIGIQCDPPTPEFTTALKLIWAAIKNLFRKAFAKLRICKSSSPNFSSV
jgi:hypothetical protein